MYGTVKIGEKEVPMLATASTPFRLKQAFGIDYFKIVTTAAKDEEPDSEVITNLYIRLAFVMAKQAEKADLDKLNEEMFLEWLDNYDPMDMMLAIDDISDLYDNQKKESTVPKDQGDQ